MAQGLQLEQEEMVTQQTGDNQLDEQFDMQEQQVQSKSESNEQDVDFDSDLDLDLEEFDLDDNTFDQLGQLGQLGQLDESNPLDPLDWELDNSNWIPTQTTWIPVEWTWTKIFGLVVQIILGLYAARLSWNCNTSMRYSFLVKLVSAIFAWFGGLLYILYYLLLRTDICRQYIK